MSLFSNDWLEPVKEEARRVLVICPFPEVATTIAATVLVEEDIYEIDVPWTVVFDSESIEEAIPKLVNILTARDGDTPSQDVNLRETINRLKLILWKADADTNLRACHAAYAMVQVAANKEDEDFRIYQDSARRYPQYADKWLRKLEEQFGKEAVRKAVGKFPEFFILLGRQLTIAKENSPRTLMRSGENPFEYIKRALTVAAEVGFGAMNEILNKRLISYERASYALRGLSPRQETI